MAIEKIFQTARRAATIGRIAAAARRAARESGAEKEAAQRALAGLMADARGIPMKVGQFLAGNGQDAIFKSLATGVEPLPFDDVRPALEAALGGPLEAHFAAVESRGIAASLGQVHRATLHNGNDVAVKVRYPGIVASVEAELRLAKLLPGLGPVRAWGFDLEAYKRVLCDDLREELDYGAERGRQERFANTINVSGLVVPRVYPALSTESVLTQSWEGGALLDQITHWPEGQRKHTGVILLCTLFQSLFVHGEIHGDPHLGNYRYRIGQAGTPEVVLFDYGCTVAVDRTARLALLKLILGAIDEDGTEPMRCFQAMGFDARKLDSIQAVLPALAKVLLEPFTLRTPFVLRHWNLGKRVDNLLGELKWWFRSAGPANLLLLLRAFQGLIMQLEALQVSLPWQAILFRVVDPALRKEARQLALPPLPASTAGEIRDFSSLARYLKVRVLEDGRQVVSVTFPASQTAILEEIVPEKTREKIAAAGLDLDAIKQRACASGLGPQALFEFEEANRSYRVWLE